MIAISFGHSRGSRNWGRYALLLCLSLTALSPLYAHGGVDDEAPPSAAPSVSSGQLSVSANAGAYEVFVRYAAPKLGLAAPLKIFISQWSTNKPVNASEVSLTFPSSPEAKVTSPLKRTSDGIYEATAIFSKDGSYTALLKFTVGGEQQPAALGPIYAGATAAQQLSSDKLAPTPTSNPVPLWMILVGVLILLMIAVAIRTRRRKRQLALPPHISSSTKIKFKKTESEEEISTTPTTNKKPS